MNIALIYSSRGGSTRKVAQAMAEELEITPIDVKKETPDVSDVDLLIVGSGTYGGKPGKKMVKFLVTLDATTNKQVAFFSTCAGDATTTLAAMKEIMANKGYTLGDCFSCFGKFTLIKRGHPTKEELNQAKEFARNLKKI